MKTQFSILGAVCLFFIAPTCFSEDSQALKASFQSLATSLSVQQPWIDGPPSPPQKKALAQLERLANDLLKQPDHATVMLNLLNDYRDQDGYPRQELFGAVIGGRGYQVSDLPFLKSVLLASVNYKYDDPPGRYKMIWFDRRSIRRELGERILATLGPQAQSLADNPDWDLIETSPAAWLTKHIP